jgi:hypothetical protein
MEFDPKIWGPHYWFVLHTIALTYPIFPNDVAKKKYYDFIQNVPLFLPNEDISKDFSRLLDKFPVTPYLDSRESFIKWVHFIHNQVNQKLNKPELLMSEALNSYYQQYRPQQMIEREKVRIKEKYIFSGLVMLFLTTIIVLSKK